MTDFDEDFVCPPANGAKMVDWYHLINEIYKVFSTPNLDRETMEEFLETYLAPTYNMVVQEGWEIDDLKQNYPITMVKMTDMVDYFCNSCCAEGIEPFFVDMDHFHKVLDAVKAFPNVEETN